MEIKKKLYNSYNMKEIIFSDKFVKFNSKNTILIVKNFVKKDECYKIIDKFHAYKKEKSKKKSLELYQANLKIGTQQTILIQFQHYIKEEE